MSRQRTFGATVGERNPTDDQLAVRGERGRGIAAGTKGSGTANVEPEWHPRGWLRSLLASRLIVARNDLAAGRGDRATVLRRILGVSWRTHEAQRAEIRELERIIGGLRNGKLTFQEAYAQERRDLAACRAAAKSLEKERDTLAEGRDTLIEINRHVGRELYRVRELFSVVFSSKRARELALEKRAVTLERLRKVHGGSRFSAAHVTEAVTVANRELQREAERKTGREAGG